MRKYPIIVIGAGAGGLVVAVGAAKAGKRVLLIEKGKWGGDCTNYGCIPSKSLIASAENAHAIQQRDKFGVDVEVSSFHAEKALERVRALVAEVRTHTDPKALSALGVETITGTARFVDSRHIYIPDEKLTVEGKDIVIATGSGPKIPSIPGLLETPFLTNETIFDLEKIPRHLVVLGGGPIGCELAQAFRRLGAQVTLVHRRTYLLKKEEPEAQQLIAKTFEAEGIRLCLGHEPQYVNFHDGQFTLSVGEEQIGADALLVAVGRCPNIADLHLEAAGVHYTDTTIPVDSYGRTSNKHIWAVGDVLGGAQFTHLAENQARMVLTSLLLPIKKKLSRQPTPRVTFTDPEVASVGMLEKEAKERYPSEQFAVHIVPFSKVDRAITAGKREGFVKIIAKKFSGRILGATIVGPRAGEMLPEISLAMYDKIPLRKLVWLVHPYPTYNEAIRRAGDMWFTQTFIPAVKNALKNVPWKRFLPIAIILLLMGIVYMSGVHKYLTFSNLKAHHSQLKFFVEARPMMSATLFILTYIITSALCLPVGIFLSLFGGFLFPVPWSTLYVVVGATLGSTIIFLAARTAIGDFLKKRAGPFLQKMEKGFQKNAWSYLLLLRFVPIFPFWLINIAPAFFGVRFITFFWTTLIGIIPGAYVFTQAGAGLSAIFASGQAFSFENILNTQVKIALVALGIFALIPIVIKKILVKKSRK